MKHSTDRRTPRELDEESRRVIRENSREERYERLVTNLYNESATWPDESRSFFRMVMSDIHIDGVSNVRWPDDMAPFEQRIMQEKFDKLIALRPHDVTR